MEQQKVRPLTAEYVSSGEQEYTDGDFGVTQERINQYMNDAIVENVVSETPMQIASPGVIDVEATKALTDQVDFPTAMGKSTSVTSQVLDEVAEAQQAVKEVLEAKTSPRPKAIIGDLIEVCPCKTHAWYESNVGTIRKPIWEAEQQFYEQSLSAVK